MRKAQFLVSALLLILLVAACAPTATPTPALPASAPQAPAPAAISAPVPAAAPATTRAKPAGDEKWERALAEAKKEGKVVIVTTAGGSLRSTITEGFRKSSGIPAESIAGIGEALAVRILAERRAGIYSYDVYVGGSGSIIELKPRGVVAPLEPALIQPELTDPELIKKTWFLGRLPWIDNDRTIIITAAAPIFSVAINPNLVKEGEITSYQDLLNPKWKGKVILYDPSMTGTGQNFATFCKYVLGWNYFVSLLNTKPMVLSDKRLMLEWLAHGKAAIVAGPNSAMLEEFVQAGAPVKGLIPKEGSWLSSGSTSLSLFRDAPHGSAAKVFVNWFLGKEGNTLVVEAAGSQSTRLDVPTKHVPPERLRQEGVKYFEIDNEQVLLDKPAVRQEAAALLKSLGLIK